MNTKEIFITVLVGVAAAVAVVALREKQLIKDGRLAPKK